MKSLKRIMRWVHSAAHSKQARHMVLSIVLHLFLLLWLYTQGTEFLRLKPALSSASEEKQIVEIVLDSASNQAAAQLPEEPASGTSDPGQRAKPTEAIRFSTPSDPAMPSSSTEAERSTADIVQGAVQDDMTGNITLAEVYFPASELTHLPVPIGEIDLESDSMKNDPFIGSIDLTLFIDEMGFVVKVQALNESKESMPFWQLAIERFGKARFKPAQINGKAVKSQISIRVVRDKDDASGGMLNDDSDQ